MWRTARVVGILAGLCLLALGCAKHEQASPKAAKGASQSRDRAEELCLELGRAVRSQGYGDVVTAYFQRLGREGLLSQKGVPDEQAGANSLSPKETLSPQEAQLRLASAQNLVNKYLAEHPDRPQTAAAMVLSGDLLMEQSFANTQQAKSGQESEEPDRSCVMVRQVLADARARFEGASARYARLRSVKTPNEPLTTEGNRNEAALDAAAVEPGVESSLAESWFKTAQVDYFTARTYSPAEKADRRQWLTQAATGFDKICQAHRGTVAALLARDWQAKALDDLGDAQTAMDIYDEILVAAPDRSKGDQAQATFFSKAALSRLRLPLKGKRDTELLKEAEEWLREHRDWQEVSAYAGIQLEVAKVKLEMAKDPKRPDLERKSLLRESKALLPPCQ